MKLTDKAMTSPIGLRVTFDTAPVEKFHVNAILPDPADSYRIDATITMPKDRQDSWLDGVVAAFRRLQCGVTRTIQLDFQNVIRFFDLEQLERIDKRNQGFSMHIYGVPTDTLDKINAPKISVISASDFNQMYYQSHKRKKEYKEEQT